ncbi:glycoside-pentoside-hexuronide (GPH):cation symporter [Oceanirhabdus seepicola]|uniref:MFS transporter n=1 Tax=Oceanirhabdus seepicola TaxID=2828781 RepID=A0A9J6NY13_9CLOT|nr:glycoside-pentoside-hexuronide (GPH):cation symporter [Oceanirhabdus seepicola]MCM1989155.1 MFS transporter [Oceanirhabdus seepicola]
MKRITFKNKFGYMMGDVANGLTFGMSAGFLLAFYTDALGITAAAAGTLFLIARIWDAVNDPMMGAFTDRMFKKRMLKNKGKKVDKFRPYLLKGCWLVVAASILMFIAPNSLSGAQKLIWAYATYIAWGMAYTFVNIPYGSLAAVMTQDPVERSALAVARGIGGMIGNIAPRILVPLVLAGFADNLSKGYLIAMAIFGVMAVISYIVAYLTVEENIEHKINESDQNEKVSFKESFSVLVKNRPFVAVSIASIAMLFGFMINSAMTLYYFKENLNALKLMAITGVTGILPTLILAPFMSKIVKKFGVKKTVSISSLISAVIYGTLLILPDNPYTYITVTFFAGIFMTIPNMLVWGMVSDCIDYNQYLCGKRQEGVIYGSYSFVRKMGQAFAGFMGGVGLSIIGYVPNAASQTASVLFGIKFLIVGLPAIGMFIAFLSYQFIWNLTPEKQVEVVQTINS